MNIKNNLMTEPTEKKSWPVAIVLGVTTVAAVAAVSGIVFTKDVPRPVDGMEDADEKHIGSTHTCKTTTGKDVAFFIVGMAFFVFLVLSVWLIFKNRSTHKLWKNCWDELEQLKKSAKGAGEAVEAIVGKSDPFRYSY